jgi:hypothetical protein
MKLVVLYCSIVLHLVAVIFFFTASRATLCSKKFIKTYSLQKLITTCLEQCGHHHARKLLSSSRTRYAAQTQQERTQPTNWNTYAHRGKLYVNNVRNKRRQQFPRPIILTHWSKHVVIDF